MKGQPRSGTPFTAGGNRSRDAGPGKTRSVDDVLWGTGNGGSNGYDGPNASRSESRGGRLIEGQTLRGYVEASRADLPTPQDTTKNPDGTARVRSL